MEHLGFESVEFGFAPREAGSDVALVAGCGFVQGTVEATAVQGVLDDETAEGGVPLGPGEVEFTVEREGGAFVGGIADREEGDEAGPEENTVDGEDGTGVEDRSGRPDEESQQVNRG